MEDKINIYSPIDGSVVGKVPSMTKEDVDQKINLAKKAFKEWSSYSPQKRSKYLYDVAYKLEKSKEKIAKTMVKEIAKSLKDSISEIERTVKLIKYSAEESLRIEGKVLSGGNFSDSDNNRTCIEKYVPYGVVLCISPFNYPINLSMAKIATALLAGNTVVFKPSTQGSVSAMYMIEAIKEALPLGVLNFVSGKGSVIGDYLTSHKDIDFVNFTGSTEIGKRIPKLAGMKPVILELGGKDAAIVLNDANLEKTAKQIIQGAFSYSGQRCTAIKRVLAQEKIYDKLLKLLNNELQKLKVGSVLKDNVDVGELIDNKSADYIEGLIKETINKKRRTSQIFKREGNLIYPMIFDGVLKEDRLFIEEPFGPVLPVTKFENIEDAIELANSSNYGLQSSVFTQDIDKAFYIADKLEVGSVQINNKTQRGPDNFSFLGIKDSGLGVQGIRSSIISMMRIKTIVLNF